MRHAFALQLLSQTLFSQTSVGEIAQSFAASDSFDSSGEGDGLSQGVGAFSWDAPPLPPVVVVHGRRGANSNINGIYKRDYTWQNSISSCYRRSGTAEHQTNIYLYFEGEWRLGPSPDEGSVWAFAPSDAASPLSLTAPWQVWDGQRVVQDDGLRVSDASVIPSVLFLSFSGDAPTDVRNWQGMLVQEPGLWEGRPYYRHQAFHDFFLLCSVAEGQWRLGPLPVYDAQQGQSSAVLFAVSASTLPQEISESWHVNSNTSNPFKLGEGVLRLSTATSRQAAALAPRPQYPLHLVVQGFSIEDGLPNGVYRRAREQMHGRPVYHKTDALRASSLWFSGEWRLGSSIQQGRIWAYAASTASLMSLKVPWQRLEDGHIEQTTKLVDANDVIPSSVSIGGERYLWTQKLCDARPVYQRDSQYGNTVFLFFRAHLSEWWLGPVIGGSECYATARGSRLHVVPRSDQLLWQLVDLTKIDNGQYDRNLPFNLNSEREGDAGHMKSGQDPSSSSGEAWRSWWRALVVSVVILCVSFSWFGSTLALKASLLGILGCDKPGGQSHDRLQPSKSRELNSEVATPRVSQRRTKPKSPKASALSCVVCMDAPREVLLMPCRHVCSCRACAVRLHRCPMCRTLTGDFTKVFL